MKTDIEIQKDVLEQLKWEPFLNASEIGVAVKNGIVTLSGIVDSYSKKVLAEKVAKKIAGVRAIALDIQVGLSPVYRKTDTEVAEAAVNALKWHTMIPDQKIAVGVENGSVKLEGEVDWDYQRRQALKAVQDLIGVRSVNNLIKVKDRITSSDIQKSINNAFQRSASIDADKIKVNVMGSRVTLSGTVRSLPEKEDAENAVWFAKGVTSVDNKLTIEEPEYSFEE